MVEKSGYDTMNSWPRQWRHEKLPACSSGGGGEGSGPLKIEAAIPFATSFFPPAPKMELTEFAAHVKSHFNINKIEPWSSHFRSLEPKYLDDLSTA